MHNLFKNIKKSKDFIIHFKLENKNFIMKI